MFQKISVVICVYLCHSAIGFALSEAGSDDATDGADAAAGSAKSQRLCANFFVCDILYICAFSIVLHVDSCADILCV